MTTKEIILNEIEKLPKSLLGELFDFIKFLESKIIQKKMETAVMSESTLKKDWLKPEEDEAWKDL